MVNDLADELERLASLATEGEWAYRPDEYDDWGIVKSAPVRCDGFDYDLRCVLAQFRDPRFLDEDVKASHRAAKTDPWQGNAELVVALKNNLPAILSALRRHVPADVADELDTYEMGKRDGYELAVQDIDLMTGGDGEYFASTIPGRGCPDAATMKRNIAERFTTLASGRDEARGEPVAWMYERECKVDGYSIRFEPLQQSLEYCQSQGWTETPLYALPTTRRPAMNRTEEGIN